MHKQIEKSHYELASIIRIDRELERIRDIDLLIEKILLLARTEAHADAGTVYIREEDKLVFRHTQNRTLQQRLRKGEKIISPDFSIPINDKTISGFVALTNTVLNISNMYEIPSDAPYSFDTSFDTKTGYRTVSSLNFPLNSTEGELLGVMQLINAYDENGSFIPFGKERETFFEVFAIFASKAIERASLTRNLIDTMISLANLRDPKETSLHICRVAYYSTEIYEAWAVRHKIDPGEVERNRDKLRMAAMLHDVGKVAISDAILKKCGPLSSEEYNTMKSHTWLGARQFIGSSDLSESAREVALYHHEHWDGSGYPGRLVEMEHDAMPTRIMPGPGYRGTEIPLFARIVSLSDFFDALSSSRAYKDAWTEDRVLACIREEAGRKFDPELVDVFFSIFPNIRKLRERFTENN